MISAVSFESGTIIRSDGLNTQITFDNSGVNRDATADSLIVDESFILFYNLVVEITDDDYQCSELNITGRDLNLFSDNFKDYCTCINCGGSSGESPSSGEEDTTSPTGEVILNLSNITKGKAINFHDFETSHLVWLSGEENILKIKTFDVEGNPVDVDELIVSPSENTSANIRLLRNGIGEYEAIVLVLDKVESIILNVTASQLQKTKTKLIEIEIETKTGTSKLLIRLKNLINGRIDWVKENPTNAGLLFLVVLISIVAIVVLSGD